MSANTIDLEAGNGSSTSVSAGNIDAGKFNSIISSSSLAGSTKDETDKDEFLVEYEGLNDPLDPQNLPEWKKWSFLLILGFMTLVTTFASSVFSTATEAAAKEFKVTNEIMTLGTALFIAGFSVGPMFYGPMSELWGRKKPLFIGYVLFIICQVPVGVAQNVETIMLFRFFGGIAAAGPLSIVGGWCSDFFDPVIRGLAMAVLAGIQLLGPILGPIIGGFITQSYLGWRWTAWITLIMAALFGIVGIFVLPETHAQTLLTKKARRIRLETRNWAVHSKLEEKPIDVNEFVMKYLDRPFRMLFLEPILVLMTLYMAFIYGFIYLLFEAWPITFIEQRGFNQGVGGLPFIAIGIGAAIGIGFIAWHTIYIMRPKFERDGFVTPEDRLVPMMLAAFIFPAGLFWFAWTSFPTVNPWPQILSGVPIGMGFETIFIQCQAYLLDVYTVNANSAISANAIVRSIVAAGFVMFAVPMYRNLGVQWATTLLAFLASAFIPIPILFWVYGGRIRTWSKYAPTKY